MSAPSTSGLSVELLLRVIDVKYGCFTLLYFTLLYFIVQLHTAQHETSSAYPFKLGKTDVSPSDRDRTGKQERI